MFLLRSRLRAINSSKQTLMAENTIQTSSSSSSPEQNQSPPLSSFLNSPRFFGGFLSRSISDEISATPTSILDTKFSNCTNHHHHHHPFGYDKNVFKSSPISSTSLSPDNNINNKHPYEKQGIGLALIHDKNTEEEEDYDTTFSKQPNNKMVLFAAKLKVEVPPFFTSDFSPISPGDFGIKTKNPQLLRSLSMNSPCNNNRGRLLLDHHDQEGISVSEMEMSEEYTCVITHGPNPKITHIFDDTVVESCCGTENLLLSAGQKNERAFLQNNVDVITSLPVDFLGFCYACKNKLEDEKDIYMFRGEKAFCSEECRFQEMVTEGKQSNDDSDSNEDSYHFL